jgi:hypothetical protein
MKTAEEILAEASTMIAHIHNRTGMYIGSLARPGAADTLDAVFWLAHWFWYSIQDREAEHNDLYYAICERHKFSGLGFPDGFRHLNPDADEEAACRFVLAGWREIDGGLGIDISPEA